MLTLILSYIGIRPIIDIQEKLFPSIFLLSKQVDGNLLEIAWFLSYELSFYIMAFFMIFVQKKYDQKKIIIALIVIFFLYNSYRYGFHKDLIFGGVWPFRQTMSALTIEFLLGYYLTTMERNIFAKKDFIPVYATIACLSFIAGTHDVFFVNYEFLRVSTFGISSVFVLLLLLFLEEEGVGTFTFINKVGDSSYSLYLLHPLILACIGAVLARISGSVREYIILAIPFICIFISLLWFYCIEKKLYSSFKLYFELLWLRKK